MTIFDNNCKTRILPDMEFFMESQELKKLPFCIVFTKNNKIFKKKKNGQYTIFRQFLPKFGQKSIFQIFIKDFFSKCDQISSFRRIWSHLMNKSLMENFIFYVVERTN